MTPERWQQVKGVLHSVLELAPSERVAFLDQACDGDEPLRQEVESLLAADDEPAHENKLSLELLSQPDVAVLAAASSRERADLWVGRWVGPYKIIQQIGAGGMGEVYRAIRDDAQYRKQVAIKVVRAGQDSALVVRRFKNERQILASLDHPNVARLLDGGTTKEGAAYFVMELIEGEPVDQYCNHRNLAVTERLNLFLQVCAAVQYAHQRLIIHRDIKPGNILVTSEGVPKLLDFGIAKLLDGNTEGGQAEITLTIFRILTPAYASPEQVKGEAITTASDVYSLGVVLYELLTGNSPYQVTSHLPHEMVRAVCEVEPEAPSTALRRRASQGRQGTGQKGKDQVLADRPHDGSLQKLSKRLSGDLDNIVLMALRKEPQRRYASVEQFAEDIRRHLEHLPVIARKDTIRYRTSKFVTRHKTGVVSAVLVSLMLLAALAVTIREARVAQQRFNDVRELANSLIFDVHDSIKDLPGSTPARKLIVDRALRYLNRLAQESRGDLPLQRELATAYEKVGLVQGHYLENSLGDTRGSLESYQKALSIRKQIMANSSDESDRLALAESQRLAANQQWALGTYAVALENIAAAIATSEALNSGHPKDLKILRELGSDYEFAGTIQGSGYAGGVAGDPAKSEEYYRKALATDEALLNISPNVADIQDAYATALYRVAGASEDEDVSAALGYYNKELEIEQKLHQSSPELRYARGVAHAYSHIAQMYGRLGDSRLSFESYMRGLKVSLELVRVDPKNAYFQQSLAIAYSNTAHALSQTSRDARSLDYMEKALLIMRDVAASAPENKQQQGYLAAVIATNGVTLMNLGKPEAALNKLGEARSILESLRGSAPIDTGGLLTTCTEKMGEAAARAGNSALAVVYFNEVLRLVEPALRTQEVDHEIPYLAADSYSGLGDLQLQKARDTRQNPAKRRDSWTQARSCYRKSLDAWRLIEHPHHTDYDDFEVGDPAQIERNLQQCESALAKLSNAQHSTVANCD